MATEQGIVVSPASSTTAKKYPTAVIYVLQCVDNYYYIGSTINDPRYRFSNHKKDSEKYPHRAVYEHINAIGWPNVQLQVVEAFPCDTKEELYRLEDEYVKESLADPYCLNHNRAHITAEEHKENCANYYIAHREQIKERAAQYAQANKEKVDAYQAAYRQANAEERSAYSRQYAADHPEQVKATRKAYYEANKEECTAKQKAYVEANKEDVAQRKRDWVAKNKEAIAEKHRAYVEENKEKIQERGKAYYEANKEAILEKNRAYQAANKDALKARQKAYLANRAKLTESHTCDCGGKYTAHHEKRHRESKRHVAFLDLQSADVTPPNTIPIHR